LTGGVPADAPDTPDLARSLDAAELDPLAVADGDSWEDLRVADVDLSELAARALRFNGVLFERVDLREARLAALALVDCDLAGCDLSNLAGGGASLRRVVVRDGRLTGLQLGDASMRDVAFRDCRLNLGSLVGAELQRVVFSGCDLTDADLRDTRCSSVVFEHCDLTRADLAGARLEDCELRGCTLDGLAGVESLSGVAMPWADIVANAGTWAAALGIELSPEQREEAARKPPPL
jgi:uncharacterized protein YjbI with pentapeptide repeats